MENTKRKLVFANGQIYTGQGFGANTERICEVVFNTAMVGYQEIFSDSSCQGLFVCMTYPLIGNYGLAADDYENRTPVIGGFIVREYNESLANFRAAKTLAEEMEENGIPGIAGVDTRRITRMIRDEGSMMALLCPADTPDDEALAKVRAAKAPTDQVAQVSSKKKWYWRAANTQYNVVAVDCGIKLGIIRHLAQRGCNITVVPYSTSAEEILALAPDGVLISNGPGNPADVPQVVETIQALRGKLPLFGISLGHLLIAMAGGCQTGKLKFGHHGGNHPVKELATGNIEITSQGHAYVVNKDSVAGTGFAITHMNLLDDTVEGLEDKANKLFSVQFHPESNPGPQDSAHLFDKFTAMMQLQKRGGGHYA